MYKFSDKKNREDVIALRWPKACLLCGSDAVFENDARYAIVGNFYVQKKTQVLIKLPGFFYMCNECSAIIESVIEQFKDNNEKLVEIAVKLKEAPWNQILELERNGCIRLPEGEFKAKLSNINPEGCFQGMTNPMEMLKKAVGK